MATQGNQPLPSKEANLFRQLVKFYETKQYKKGLKAADQILKKFPEHGETLAMKGLTLNCLDRKEEAYDLVRKGLKADLKSHVCWHVYGLLYRSDREYREAIKCYQNALRLDKENIQILRDLALLQIQMRDTAGFVETRHQLLTLKPANRNHWISFAISHHINKNFDVAVQVLEAYEGTLEEVSASEAYEHSEMLLYKATILVEGGKLADALEVLEKNKDKIKDKLGWQESMAAVTLGLGRLKEAEELYRKLLVLNPDHYKYHEGLQTSLNLRSKPGSPLSAQQVESLGQLYDELQSTFPHSSACFRIPFDFKSGDDFRLAVDRYMRRYLLRGIPSLFADLKPLYKDPAKVQIIEALIESYSASLRTSGSFPTAAGEESTGNTEALVWVLYYSAQHYDRLKCFEKALSLLDEAIAMSPTLIELYTGKSKVLKHAGDLAGAAYYADQGRRMDLADRYLNSMVVKALFCAGYIEQADRTAALFTKDGDQTNNLFDMQHMWYEIACGKAYMRQKQYGKALKKFLAVGKHFADIHEDQFDFHSYCIRKMTLRAYLSMLRLEDTLYSHAFYYKATCQAVQTYLDLYDSPPTQDESAEEEQAMAGLSPDERKKLRLKRKKEEKRKKEQEERERAEAERLAKEKEKEAKEKGEKKKAVATEKKEKDPDPDGEKLAATEDPLGEATKLVVMLKEHAGDKLDTQLAAFEVYSRKGKALMCLAAVQRALRIGGAAHPRVHLAVVRGCLQVQRSPPEHAVIRELSQQLVAEILGVASVAEYQEAWLKSHAAASLAAACAGAESLLVVDPAARQRATALVMDAKFSPSELSHRDCEAAHQLLLHTLKDESAAATWKSKCAEMFPRSPYFGGAKVLGLVPEVLAATGNQPPVMNGTAAAPASKLEHLSLSP